MPNRTGIEWADLSTNPLRAIARGSNRRPGWSCAKISPGCLNCYAATLNNRFGNRLPFSVQGVRDSEFYLDEGELRHILRFKPRGPFKGGTARPKVFAFDMTDVFGDWVPDSYLDILFAHFAARPDVDFLVLTKRPERACKWMAGLQAAADDHAPRTAHKQFTPAQVLNLRMFAGYPIPGGILGRAIGPAWPLPNVWLGVSVEDQKRADERIPWLLKTPAAVRFLSCEPLLEELDISYPESLFPNGPPMCCSGRDCGCMGMPCEPWPWLYPKGEGIDWAIVGGESGHGARPCNIAAVRSLVSQCKAASVPVFVKQLGSNIEDGYLQSETWMQLGAREISGMGGKTFVKLNDRKGGNVSEWPADLRVREFPEVPRA